MCVFVCPTEFVTFPWKKTVTTQKWVVDFLGGKRHIPKNVEIAEISLKKVTKPTANPGNRQGFCVEIFNDFALFIFETFF